MKNNQLLVLCLLLCVSLLASGRAGAQIVVEDFKGSGSGFDLVWGTPVTEVGSGPTTFTSNGEIGQIRTTGPEGVLAGVVQTDAGQIPWDVAKQRYIQVMTPNLPFGYRWKFMVYSDVDNYATGYMLHDEWLAIPGQGPRPQTFDVNAVVPAGTQQILLRINDIFAGYGPAGAAEVNIDWIKCGMKPDAAAAPGIPGFAGPADGAQAANPPTLTWTAPAGFTGGTYTVTYSQDQLFSNATTVTVLDGVTGTSYTPAAPLAAGTWYWTVSATNADRMSGLVLEKALADGGDARDPGAHRFYSFTVIEVPVELSAFSAE